MFVIFFIGSIAETNRAPFDLAEAESELVSGFMTEHSAVIFVFFFLAEYASIVLICILSSLLFIGGYLEFFSFTATLFYNVFILGLVSGLNLGIKTSILVFIFIWVRASFPRARYDQLMLFCWVILLPIVIAFIILIPCIIYSLDMLPANIYLI